MGSKSRLPWKIRVLAILASIAVVYGLFSIVDCIELVGYLPDNHRFDQAIWKANPGPDLVRLQMADDLMTNYLKEGMSVFYVMSLLGKSTYRRVDRGSRKQLIYHLGNYDYFLRLVFSTEDRLESAVISQT